MGAIIREANHGFLPRGCISGSLRRRRPIGGRMLGQEAHSIGLVDGSDSRRAAENLDPDGWSAESGYAYRGKASVIADISGGSRVDDLGLCQGHDVQARGKSRDSSEAC